MAHARPSGMDWESWIDQVIRDGRERGEFDDLPGTGKPIADLNKPHDEMWWVRRKLKSEGVSYLPPALALRKDREDTLSRLETERSEERARLLLEELNTRIRHVNSRSIAGPPSTVMPLDVESVLQEWRERRAAARSAEVARRQEQPGALRTPTGKRRSSLSGWFRRQRRGGRPG